MDILIASNDDFETCVTWLLDKYNMVNTNNPLPRQNNKVQRGNNKPRNTNQRSHNGGKQPNNPKKDYNAYISLEDWKKLSKKDQVDIMKKRGTCSHDYSQRTHTKTYPNTQHPNKGRQGMVTFGKKTTRHISNIEQSGYDYEKEESDIGREEKTVPRNTPTPSINSIITSIWQMNSIMVNTS